MSVKTRSVKALINRICRSKVVYENEAEAEIAAAKFWANNKSKQVAYLCENCGKYHLTTVLEQGIKTNRDGWSKS